MVWFLESRRRRADKLLAAGKTAKAIELYRKAKAWDALAKAYQISGDIPQAAEAARDAGLHELAAKLFEQAGRLGESAEMWLTAGRAELAAHAYERAKDIDAAVELYISAGKQTRAADLLAAQERLREAGELYEGAGETAKAASAYQKAGMLAEAARVLEKAGQLDESAQLYYDAGDKAAAARLLLKAGRPLDSARCLAESGDIAQAGAVLEEAGYPLEAAEQYEKDPSTLTKAAALFCKCLQPEKGWRNELASQAVCFDMSDTGSYIAVGFENSYVQLLNEAGESVWRYRPAAGTRPKCLALSPQALCALGCDDKRMYMIGADKAVLWTTELPDEPLMADMGSTGERVVCCTKVNTVHCLDKKGALLWEYPVRGIVCDLDLSPDGNVVAIGTTDGLCIFLNADGERTGELKMKEWIDGVALSDDGARCAVILGMSDVGLLDVAKKELLWSRSDDSPVHAVILAANHAVFSVSDERAILRDATGGVLCRYSSDRRLMGGRVSGTHRFAVLWNDHKELMRIDLKDCRLRAAANYEKAGSLREAAALYESLGEHVHAAKAFKAAGDLRNAARNIEVGGSLLEAATMYESLGDFDKAAPIFEAEGELARAARSFSKTGQWVRAAVLYEQAKDLANAAELFERAGQYDKAGALYKAVGNVAAAIKAFSTHIESHPDAAEFHLELGLLLQGDGQHDKAIESLQAASKSEAHRKSALMHLAECFVAKNLYSIAVSRYQACLKENDKVSWDNLDVYYGLGKTYHLSGNYGEARRIYESILAINYNYEDVRKRLSDVEALGSVFAAAQPPQSASEQRTVIVTADNSYQRLSADTKERYVVKKELGKGGMGQVFLAEDKRLKRSVALKILAPHLAADQGVKARMIHEAQAAAQIEHPNCVRVFDVGDEGDRCYITMEYVTGRTLRSLLEEKGALDAKECVSLLIQLTEGLGYAHKKSITHRDIKPENAILTSDGTLKIMDFGLALVTGATRLTMGGVCGTIPYMAPEQVRGEANLTPAVDIYATGCMAYEMLTGKLPFEGADMGAARLTQDPKPIKELRPDVPDALIEVVSKCMARKVAERYQDGSALNAALKKVAGKLA